MKKTFTLIVAAALTAVTLSTAIAQAPPTKPDPAMTNTSGAKIDWVKIHTQRMLKRLAELRRSKAKVDSQAAADAKTPIAKLIAYCPDCNVYYSSADGQKMKLVDPKKHKLYLCPKDSIASDAPLAHMPGHSSHAKKHHKTHKA